MKIVLTIFALVLLPPMVNQPQNDGRMWGCTDVDVPMWDVPMWDVPMSRYPWYRPSFFVMSASVDFRPTSPILIFVDLND